jgi:hypothetical protein
MSLIEKNNNLKEQCVMCDSKTEYTKNTHIDQRKHYIEGAGQICEECYIKIY